MAEEINPLIKITDEYLYSLVAKDRNVSLYFQNSKLLFNSYLIFKSGYPNIDVSIIQNKYQAYNLRSSILYEVVFSSWITKLISINRIHQNHKDEIFGSYKHFIILFEDETFECIAESYQILNNV